MLDSSTWDTVPKVRDLRPSLAAAEVFEVDPKSNDLLRRLIVDFSHVRSPS